MNDWLMAATEQRARLKELAERLMLTAAEVREAEMLATELGVSVTLQRVDLSTGKHTLRTINPTR